MAFLNVSTVVTKALSKVVDNSPDLRAKFVIWFNEISRDIFNQPRDWAFLAVPVTLPIVANKITLPAGSSEIVSMVIGDVFLTRNDQMGPLRAFTYKDSTDTVPVGYTLAADGTITFYPGATGDCVLTYEKDLDADYTDDTVDTIFPLDLEGLFITGLRMHNYDYDKDGRYSKEVALYQYEMSKAKAWDNRNKPRIQPSRYIK